jgi:hypothetical protein
MTAAHKVYWRKLGDSQGARILVVTGGGRRLGAIIAFPDRCYAAALTRTGASRNLGAHPTVKAAAEALAREAVS